MTLRTLLPTLIVLLLWGCGGAKPVATDDPKGGETAKGEAGQDRRAAVMSLFLEATNARLAGQNAKALQLYQQCVKLDPGNGAAYFELGKLYHQGQNSAQALDNAKRAVAADQENIWYRFLLADLYQQYERPADAAEVYRGILQRWPDRYETYLDLANTLAYSGKVGDAIKVFQDVEERFGLSEELIMQQFGMLAANQRFEEAEKLVQRAVAAYPNEPSFQGLLGELYDQRGEHEKARDQYLKALELDPGNSMLRIALAEHYYGQDQQQLAFEQLELAFLDPEMDLDAKMQVLIGFFEMSNFEGESPQDRPQLIERSYSLIEVLERAHPESGKPHTIHGDFLLRDGRYAEARDQFRKALVQEKERYPIWSQLLQLDLELGDMQGLHTDAEEAISLFPMVPDNYLFNGIALSQLKRHEEAIETLIMGRDLVVDNPPLLAQFWSSLGDAYHANKEHERSDNAYEKALSMDPDNVNTLNNYAYYLSERNEDLAKAERMSKRSNELAPDQPSYQDTYAWILFRAGKFAEARTWIEKAIASGGKDQGVIVEHYGDILYKLGETTAAMEQWKRAKELGDTSDMLDDKINKGTWLE